MYSDTFFSLRSSIGELAVLDVASPSKKHSLVISSWEEREELRWGSTWRSERKWTEWKPALGFHFSSWGSQQHPQVSASGPQVQQSGPHHPRTSSPRAKRQPGLESLQGIWVGRREVKVIDWWHEWTIHVLRWFTRTPWCPDPLILILWGPSVWPHAPHASCLNCSQLRNMQTEWATDDDDDDDDGTSQITGTAHSSSQTFISHSWLPPSKIWSHVPLIQESAIVSAVGDRLTFDPTNNRL